MLGTSKIIIVVTCALALSAAVPTVAGILNGNPFAYNDGNGPASGAWTGSLSFNNGNGLEGDLDFAVFTTDVFDTQFGGLGYVPSAYPTGGLVYTYQLTNTAGANGDAISAEIVGITNPANTIGSFDIGDVMPSLTTFSSGNATWQYNPTIPIAMTSWGMAFSSPNAPMYGASLTIDGGGSATTVGIPTPGPNAIPEPCSLGLWAVCGALALLGWRRR